MLDTKGYFMIGMDYLDKLLKHYTGTFDLTRPYEIKGEEYLAYGYFFSHIEKYVLVRDMNMWKADSYEHLLVKEIDFISMAEIEKAKNIMETYMEPVLVRKGEKLPEQNHMYSYLTFVYLCNHDVSREVQKQIHKFKFEKGYQLNIRGYSQGRLLVVDLKNNKIYHNYQGRKLKKLYTNVFSKN